MAEGIWGGFIISEYGIIIRGDDFLISIEAKIYLLHDWLIRGIEHFSAGVKLHITLQIFERAYLLAIVEMREVAERDEHEAIWIGEA